VLLATPEIVSTFTALAIAGYVLFIAGLVSARRRITGRALAGGLVLGMVAVLAAGVVAGAAGMRELEPHEPEPADGEPADGEPSADLPPDALVWVAIDIEFAEAPATAPAGELTIAIDNQGNLPHDVAFEGVQGSRPIVHADGGQVDVGTVTLEPGTYTYYCDVPGHRATMEGQLEVTG
jgi:plastocyanin